MSQNRPKISAFIICFNEASQIRRCLESIRWCDEIVVVDSGSTDGTVQICKEYTSKIFERAWPGYVAQKQFGLEQCSGDWVFNIDSDEEVSPELREEIKATIADTSPAAEKIGGYQISRIVFYLNRWWRRGGWYPEYRLRLCRRQSTQWGGDDPHDKAIVKGGVKRLKGELFHYTYSDISDHVRRLNSYSTSSAQALYKKGACGCLLNIFINPFARFFKFYFIKRGFLEGVPGFLVACLEGYYVLLKYFKLWELRHQAKCCTHEERPEVLVQAKLNELNNKVR